ncbi:MAG: photosystem II reaction center protein Psb28 [Leptolyngbya foveolarum]|uniref:Photosystem II reaction center Psb28 protein n=1 Tax=Leptolyngbya foveolarum TaxID=47253 RepID=A0A2W4UTG4_9CYAN|nr:MAG: photosystem II reaction center protein Psb28 [Leptolyngbya foveolarum]
MAEIQFSPGVKEEVIPDIRITRAKDLSDATATFYFDRPKALTEEGGEVTGLYMVDEEGQLVSKDVNGKFVNGEPAGIEAVFVMRGPEEWDRFMRFMERYSEENGLGLTKN